MKLWALTTFPVTLGMAHMARLLRLPERWLPRPVNYRLTYKQPRYKPVFKNGDGPAK